MDETAAGLSYRRIGPRLDRRRRGLQFHEPCLGDVAQSMSGDKVLLGAVALQIRPPYSYMTMKKPQRLEPGAAGTGWYDMPRWRACRGCFADRSAG